MRPTLTPTPTPTDVIIFTGPVIYRPTNTPEGLIDLPMDTP
jgi:hypothetical protein